MIVPNTKLQTCIVPAQCSAVDVSLSDPSIKAMYTVQTLW